MKPKQDDEYGDGFLKKFVDWMNEKDRKRAKKEWEDRGSIDYYGRFPEDKGYIPNDGPHEGGYGSGKDFTRIPERHGGGYVIGEPVDSPSGRDWEIKGDKPVRIRKPPIDKEGSTFTFTPGPKGQLGEGWQPLPYPEDPPYTPPKPVPPPLPSGGTLTDTPGLRGGVTDLIGRKTPTGNRGTRRRILRGQA